MSANSGKNKLLINATHASDEIRFALVYKNKLENLYIDKPGVHRKSNIYKAKITRIEPSLQAAFVNYGFDRHGFLPFKEIAESLYKTNSPSKENITINDVIDANQNIIVQVDKEERGNKGAALTTNITLAGSYLVLMPNNSNAGGISRRIGGDERDELREIINNLNVPSHMGLIIRTAGVGKSQAELQWDLDILLKLWHAIQQAHDEKPAPFLIHQESDIVSRAIRDYLRKDIDEIIIDDEAVYNKTKDLIKQLRPEFTDKIFLYTESAPLFTKYQIESQIETAYQSEVRLPSGGSLVIQQTEALVSIDVNSSKDTKGQNIEVTAFNTNKEAAKEVARQVRLRDLGGLIVVDFIDMASPDDQREITNTFYEETQMDKARVQFGRISRFGLLEISRQRLRPSLSEYSQITCPRCNGLGNIRSIDSLSLLLLRLLSEYANEANIAEINVQVPNNVAAVLTNEKRQGIINIENENNVKIFIIANPYYETPQYKIETIRSQQNNRMKKSYEKIEQPPSNIEMQKPRELTEIDIPAVQSLSYPERPTAAEAKPASLIRRLSKLLFGKEKTEEETIPAPRQKEQRPYNPKRQNHQRKSKHSRHRQRGNQNNRSNQSRSEHQSKKRSSTKKQSAHANYSKEKTFKTEASFEPQADTHNKKKPSSSTEKTNSDTKPVNIDAKPESSPEFSITIDHGPGKEQIIKYDLKIEEKDTAIENTSANAAPTTETEEQKADIKRRRQKSRETARKKHQSKSRQSHRRRRSQTKTQTANPIENQPKDNSNNDIMFVVDDNLNNNENISQQETKE